MIYSMSNEEKTQQLGQLVIDKKASETRLAELRLKAANFGSTFSEIGRALSNGSPEQLAFQHQQVDVRFRPNWFGNHKIATEDELKALVEAIRVERIKLWGYEESLKNLGF
jgi:hypothetical protein